MIKLLMFKGDQRKKISDSASEHYLGLIHHILLEYFPEEQITLCYLFNMEDADVHKVFPESDDLLWKNTTVVKGTKSLNDIEESAYFLTIDIEESIAGDQDAYYISKNKIGKSTRLFQNLESILEHRKIVARIKMKDELGLEEIVEIRRKNHSIMIDEGRVSGSIEFDHVDELKQILIDKYSANRLVPITYTPWDSKDRHVESSRFVNDLTLLYLYNHRVFEVSR